jgi:DNA-binding FadR family transcriptional regulator
MAPISKRSTRTESEARLRSTPSASNRPEPRKRGREPSERSIQTHLVGTLGRDIVSGVYPPGSLLPNAEEMCARFSVSRTALREAYSQLTAKALIAARPKVGTRVRPASEWQFLDPDVLAWHLQTSPTEAFIANLHVLRQMVEPAAAALAATTRSPATIERIADAYGRMERFHDGSGDLIEADLDFHTGILEATDNPFLAALGGLIHASLQCAFKFSWEGAERIHADRLRQHAEVLKAIRAGSPKVASRRMSELLSDSLNDVRVFFRKREGARSSANVGRRGKV